MTDNQFNKLQHNDRNILIWFCQWTIQSRLIFAHFIFNTKNFRLFRNNYMIIHNITFS